MSSISVFSTDYNVFEHKSAAWLLNDCVTLKTEVMAAKNLALPS